MPKYLYNLSYPWSESACTDNLSQADHNLSDAMSVLFFFICKTDYNTISCTRLKVFIQPFDRIPWAVISFLTWCLASFVLRLGENICPSSRKAIKAEQELKYNSRTIWGKCVNTRTVIKVEMQETSLQNN